MAPLGGLKKCEAAVAKILIVEDDPKAAQALVSQLNAAGHACAVRHEGNGVMDLLRKGSPDLLVLDIMLPDSSGFEICRSIRRDGELFNLPILVVSAMTDSEEVQHGLSQGADMYLTKPYNAAQLVQRVDTLLREHARGENVDPVTHLANRDGIRRELQKRIGRGESFGLVYAELINLQAFGKTAGGEGREKAMRHVGRALKVAAREIAAENVSFVGHMGSGHFMCVLPSATAESLCRLVQKIWTKHVEELYGSLGLGHVLEEDRRKGVGLELQFYVTFRRGADSHSAQDLLDIVSRIRSRVTDPVGNGIHIDRRA